MEWQNNVLNSEDKYTIAKTSRGSGKTFTAIQWARKQFGKRVLFLSSSLEESRRTARVMGKLYEDEVMEMSVGPGTMVYVIFKDGTSVFFQNHRGPTRGIGVESLVIDDVTSCQSMDEIVSGRDTVEKVLIVGTETSQIMKFLLSAARASVNYIVVDYIDMITNEVYDKAFIRDMQLKMSPKEFKANFGPWEKPLPMKNEDFLYLLET